MTPLRLLCYLLLKASLSALIALAIAGNAFALEEKAKQTKPRKKEYPFHMIGGVTKHGVDTCMEGNIRYDLNSADNRTTVWLSTSSKADLAALEKAVQDGSWVRVRGRWQQGLRPDCRWVKVSSVRPVGKR